MIGLSGVGKAFTEPIIRMMAQLNKLPIIFSLSNPTANSECTAADAYTFSDGKAIFAAGSPFPDFEYMGRVLRSAQGNNMYIFPGLGLGAVIARSKKVSDTMIIHAAKALAAQVSKQDLDQGKLYPDLSQIRSISRIIAKTVAHQSFKEVRQQITFFRRSHQCFVLFETGSFWLQGGTKLGHFIGFINLQSRVHRSQVTIAQILGENKFFWLKHFF